MDAVLPLRISGAWDDYDLDRARILLHSLDFFWQGKEDLLVHIIAPEEQVAILKTSLSATPVKLHVVSELSVLPYLEHFRASPGWLKQQLIKLASFKFIDDEFFLTLDADLVCSKNITRDSFIVEDKALTDWEPRTAHADWWNGSARFLKCAPNLNKVGMAVTPEVLSTSVCRALEEFLLLHHGNSIWEVLLHALNQWSEYSIYNLFAENHDLLDYYHLGPEWMRQNRRSLRCYDNFWYGADFQKWNPARSFGEGSMGIFMVCQSSAKILPKQIWGKLSPFLPGAPALSDPLAISSAPIVSHPKSSTANSRVDERSGYLSTPFPRFIDSRAVKTIFEIGSTDAKDAVALDVYYKPQEVFVFEANPAAQEMCRRTIGSRTHFTLIKAAVSDLPGPLLFYPVVSSRQWDGRETSNIGASSLLKASGLYGETYVQEEIKVPAVRADDICRQYGISSVDLLCMHVQGSELSVLRSFGTTLQDVKYIMTEALVVNIYTGQAHLHEINKFLSDAAFKLVAVNMGYWGFGNFLYVNEQMEIPILGG